MTESWEKKCMALCLCNITQPVHLNQFPDKSMQFISGWYTSSKKEGMGAAGL